MSFHPVNGACSRGLLKSWVFVSHLLGQVSSVLHGGRDRVKPCLTVNTSVVVILERD